MEKKYSWVNPLIIGICIVISCLALAFGLSHFKSENSHVISATGSASVDFESDSIIWRGYFSSNAETSKAAYTSIKRDVEVVKKYLTDNGVNEDEMVFDSVLISRTYTDQYDVNGHYVGEEATGYQLTQGITITSTDIDKIEMISRDISSLLDQGVEFTSESPEYYYSGLDELKLDLIDKASQNAKERIEIVARNTGANLGKLNNSSIGVFQITATNTGTSSYTYDGAFDKSSRLKTASVTVKLEYGLK